MKDFIQDDLCKRNYKKYANTSNNLILKMFNDNSVIDI